MEIVSVNVGMPIEVQWKNSTIRTGIFKYPVDRALQVSMHQIEGDGQADLIHHGGSNKAVYIYASEHYEYWQQFLNMDIETGAFGENITTIGLMDKDVFIGDEYSFGTTVLMAIQPRMPCSKLGIRFNDAMMTKHFFKARKNGIYFKVINEGCIKKGDSIKLVKRSDCNISIQDIVDNYVMENKDYELIKRLIEIPIFPVRFKVEFAAML